MKILITGGLGFIGSHLENALCKSGHEVIIIDRVRVNRERYIRGDICDYIFMESAFEETKPDVVVHLAAMVSRLEAEETPLIAIQDNVDGTLIVAHFCAKYGARMFYSGSSEEYGSVCHTGKKVSEDTPFGEPTSFYSMTKRMSEEIIQYYTRNKGLTATTLRFFMLYGPGEAPSQYRSALIRFMDAAAKGEPLAVHVGTSRQWCYIDDAIQAFVMAIESKQDRPYQVFNIGNDEETQTEDLAQKIIQLTGSKSEIIRTPVEGTIIPVKLADYSKAEMELGWKAKTPLVEGLKEVYIAYNDRRWCRE